MTQYNFHNSGVQTMRACTSSARRRATTVAAMVKPRRRTDAMTNHVKPLATGGGAP